jgi:ribosomal protein S27AE
MTSVWETMSAHGRDRLVHKKVMGLCPHVLLAPHADDFKCMRCGLTISREALEDDVSFCPAYTTDIAAAWEVAAKLNLSVIRTESEYLAGNLQGAYFNDIGVVDGRCTNGFAFAPSAAEAICLAALRTVGVEV